MIDNEALARNVQAHKDADAILDLIFEAMVESSAKNPEASDGYDVRLCERVYEGIRPYLPAPKPPKPEIVPMTKEESLAFEVSLMPFGQFQGARVGETPLGYLTWFADESDHPMKAKVKRYLKSKRGQDRLREDKD